MTDPDASLRVSDAERDQTLRTLGEHAAVGRLTLDELEERSSRALAAKTRGELATLTGDLPQEAGQDRPAPTLAKKPVRWMVAIMSGSQRRGRFRAVGSINAISIIGGDEIYLHPDSSLAGKRFGEALLAFETCCLLGLRHADGKVELNPSMETKIKKGDALYIPPEARARIW